ncbi:MAG: ATP-binding protein [Burkholderiaceae bacterium]
MRSLVVLVVFLSVTAGALLLLQSGRSQAQLRAEVLEQAKQRSTNLSDAMAGQVQGLFNAIDVALIQVRREWLEHGLGPSLEEAARDALATLPQGLVTHVVMTDAEGWVVFNSLGVSNRVNLGDRDYFQQHLAGGDRAVIGQPGRSRLNGQWVFSVSRPLWRNGRFAGTLHFTMPTEALAAWLARLKLSPEDVVALIAADGNILARSVGNAEAMGQRIPDDRPFMVASTAVSGLYRERGHVDQVLRTFGWHRIPGSGAVLVVGISDAGVLRPLEPLFQRSSWIAAALSVLIGAFGALIAVLLWRVAKSQAEAGESEERLKEAQQLAHLGNWEYDVASDRLYWSDEIYRIFGMDPLGEPITLARYMACVHPEDRKPMTALYRDVSQPDKLHDAEHRIVMPDGQIKYVRELWVNECKDGQLVRNRGTLQDIDKIHTAQLALKQLNGKLEQRVEERTRELGAVNQELEAFAYSVSHDLRTPLRSIHGFATLLEEACKDIPGEATVYLQRIQHAASRMGVLITDLLSMAHHSRAPLHHQFVDLSAMAREIKAELEQGDPQRRVQWDIEDGLSVQADPTLIRVVLQNFLSNAWKYSRHADAPKISLTRSEHDNGVQEFCVRDNGAGFDMAYAEQLFQPFKRLHTNQQFEGSGVGLATVQRVVQRHGGPCRGRGAVGQGAAFCFSLPDKPFAEQAVEA